MADFQCGECGYKFKNNKVPERCPYCSFEGSVRSAKSAQDFLDESV
ncbi:MAG TPA: hypothetical protein VI564_05435 [Candidatus Nanoarchaeia archaeon]|nr:hypothetical protein [Candidatus Nanoarchaeia archaeon]